MALLRPTLYFGNVTEITLKIIKNMNIKGIILDIDGTLTLQDSQNLNDSILNWIYKILNSKINIVLLSNNTNKKRVESLSKKLNLPYIHFAMKPLPIKIYKALKIINCKKNATVIIGDQLFTDILLANIIGMRSILVDTILDKNSNLSLKQKLEIYFKNKLKIIKNQNVNLVW